MDEMHNIVVGRDAPDAEAFGERGTGTIGRHYVGEKKDAHLTNPVKLDLSRPHVIGLFGKRGTGKSYTLGVLAEELALLEEDVRKNLSCIIIDPMGIFWSMKNSNDRDTALFSGWNIKPQRFNINVAIPRGQLKAFAENRIPFDSVFSLDVSSLTKDDWALTLGIGLDSDIGILLQKSIKSVKKHLQGELSLASIAVAAKQDREAESRIKDALISRLAVASDWGVFGSASSTSSEKEKSRKAPDFFSTLGSSPKTSRFSANGMFASAASNSNNAANNTEFFGDRLAKEAREFRSLSSLIDLIEPGKITVVDLSLLEDWSVRCLVCGLLSKKILEERMEARRIEEMGAMRGSAQHSKIPITWIMIDEAHQFLPSAGETPATAALLQCVKIGREPGVSMLFATQQPNKLHEAAISQCDMIISHRLTSKQDIDSLKNIMQTYLKYDLQEYIDALPRVKGAAIILDDNSERIYAIRIRPRMSWHAGGSPIAIKEKE